MIPVQSISKNSLHSLLSTLVQKGFTLAYFIIVARVFGPEEQGMYSASLAFATLFGVFIDLGLSSALTRETARHPEKASEYFGHMVLLRLAASVIVYGMIIGSARLVGYSDLLVSMIAIAGVAACVDALSTSLWAILRGLQNLKYEAIGGVLAIGVMIALGGTAIGLGLPITALVAASLIGSVANCVYAFFTLSAKARVRLSFVIHPSTIRALAALAIPFAGAAIFSRIYTFADTAILAAVSGEHFAGVYAAGNKLILALNMIPAAISSSIFPAMSSAALRAPEKMKEIYARAHTFLFFVSLPMAVGLSLLAPDIVRLFYGSRYDLTVPVMQVLSIGLVFGFCMYPVGALLAAANRQHINTTIFGIAALVSVGLNLALIPQLAAVGSAVAACATAAVIFFASLLASWRLWREVARMIATSTLKIILATMIMASVLVLIRDTMNLFGVIGISMGVYAAAILVLDVIPSDDIERFRKMIGLPTKI